MRISFLIIATFLFLIRPSDANDVKTPKVPSDIVIAGMKLKITESARRDIQEHVNALTRSPTYFNIKLDRVKLYFPLIEKIFKEEGIPDDFKYLAIQESALISDAVSSANAVGFWQFKDFTGREVGLRIDKNVDERLNIVSSTYGVSKYFRRHNFYFKNWIYTVLAHMTGRGGAMKHVDKKQFGAKKMTIDKNTHWYVKHYLAHVIAFKSALGGSHSEGLSLLPYEKGKGKSLELIASNFKVEYGVLKKYNKWLKRGKVPAEKDYTVLIPTTKKVKLSPDKKSTKKSDEKVDVKSIEEVVTAAKNTYNNLKKQFNNSNTIYIKINGIPSILAKSEDNAESLASKGNVQLRKFLKYNDMTVEDKIIEGEVYYLKRKKNRANIYFYTVAQEESLWSISQKFGIKLKKLLKLNRMLSIDEPELGRVMWLREKRPKDTPIEIKEIVKYVEEKPIVTKVKFQEVPEEKKKKEVGKDVSQPYEELPDKKDNKPSRKGTKQITHTVKAGETLYAIARTYDVTVDDVKKWNNLSSISLSLGQYLIIYGDTDDVSQPVKKNDISKPSNKSSIIYVVKAGDTLYGISKEFEVSSEEILKWNNLTSSSLSLGQELKIKEQKESTRSEKKKNDRNATSKKNIIHIVKTKETLYGIARMYEVSVDDIMKWNKLKSSALDLGQELIVNLESDRKNTSVTNSIDNITFHVVVAGDTMYGISRKYNINVAQLLEMNNKDNVSLEIGEKLKVKD